MLRNCKPSALKIAGEAEKNTGIKLSAQKIKNFLRECGYGGRECRVRKCNKNKRFVYAAELKNYTYGYWKIVIFTGESKFNLSSHMGK